MTIRHDKNVFTLTELMVDPDVFDEDNEKFF